jgi:hypothetical protein
MVSRPSESNTGDLYTKQFHAGDPEVSERMSVLYLLQVDDTDTDEGLLGFLQVAGKSLMSNRPRCTLRTEPEVTDTFLPAIQGRINLS